MDEHRREQNRIAAERYRRRQGMQNRKERSEEIRQGVIDAYEQNPDATYEHIARLLNCSWTTVRRHAKRLGLRAKTHEE